MRRKLGWGLMTLLALGVAAYAAGMALHPEQQIGGNVGHHVTERPAILVGHFAFGAVALAVGPFQFLSVIRNRKRGLHRWLGRTYILASVLSALCGLTLALTSIAGPVAMTGFTCLALAWLGTTIPAYLKARARDFAAHRRWMIRSYALTLAAVTLRLYIPLGMMSGGSFEIVYPIVAWACWVPNLLIAEIWMRHFGNIDRMTLD